MNIVIKEADGIKIAVVNSTEILISDPQSALDFPVLISH